MVPMAIPSFGGMVVVIISIFVVPVLYCAVREFGYRSKLGESEAAFLSIITCFAAPVIYCAWADTVGKRMQKDLPKDSSQSSSNKPK